MDKMKITINESDGSIVIGSVPSGTIVKFTGNSAKFKLGMDAVVMVLDNAGIDIDSDHESPVFVADMRTGKIYDVNGTLPVYQYNADVVLERR